MSGSIVSCYVDGCICSQYLPLTGHPETCVICDHPHDVHTNNTTRKHNDDIQIISSSSSNTGMKF